MRNTASSKPYLSLPTSFYRLCNPTPVKAPKLCVSDLGWVSRLNLPSEALEQFISGNHLFPDKTYLASVYTGYQFGYLAPQLGDGRALIVGDFTDETGQVWEMQLKGAGPTPYSRSGDGRYALGPALREFLVSQAMHAFGIPTTHSVGVCETSETVIRDTPKPGAVLARLAKSHVRIGTFNYFALHQDTDALSTLTQYGLERLYPQETALKTPAETLLNAVTQAQARLVAHWISIGFVHGVLNTDNCAISGETLDYGPCAFLDTYDPHAVWSAIDQQGRYAYQNQPGIMLWNLVRLAESLLPLIDPDTDTAISKAEDILNQFNPTYHHQWITHFGKKLGIQKPSPSDEALIQTFLDLLEKYKRDFTLSFRQLSKELTGNPELFPENSDGQQWLQTWKNRLKNEATPLAEIATYLNTQNPLFIPRNHHLESALTQAENGDLSIYRDLLTVLKSPYEPHPTLHHLATPPLESEKIKNTFCGT
jgi:uncharacterized protein YdiU (UPF0061 family)